MDPAQLSRRSRGIRLLFYGQRPGALNGSISHLIVWVRDPEGSALGAHPGPPAEFQEHDSLIAASAPAEAVPDQGIDKHKSDAHHSTLTKAIRVTMVSRVHFLFSLQNISQNCSSVRAGKPSRETSRRGGRG